MAAERADLVVLGSVLTGDPAAPRAGGVAAAGGEVVAVGTREAVRALAAPGTVVLDAGPGTVLPGFRDAHVHLLSLGRARDRVDLHGCDLEEARRRVRERAAHVPVGAWVEGAGWDEDSLGLGRPPSMEDLEGATLDRPVLLLSHDHHSAWLSLEALATLGLRPGVPDPPGGKFERDALGGPTGLLRESAVWWAAGAASSSAGPAEDRRVVEAAARDLLRRGIVAVDDLDGGRSLRAVAALRRAGSLPVRVRAGLRPDDLPAFERTGLRPEVEDEGLSFAGLKVFMDGALGSRTAWMLEPYDDRPGERGLRTLDDATAKDLVRRAAALGLPTLVHAIGDAAVRAALDALASAPGLPHRVEHAQCVHPDDLPRFRALGVTASVQPGHMATDIPVARRAWGERGARAFPLRSLLDAGTAVVLGSDAPVEPAEPLRWVFCASERRTPAGEPEGGWFPGQRIPREEAFRLAAAHPLRPGAPADLVAYGRDLLACPAEELLAAEPVAVFLSGSRVEP